MGLSDGRKSFRIGLAVLIQYRSVTASHVAVAITLNAKASSLKTDTGMSLDMKLIIFANMNEKLFS